MKKLDDGKRDEALVAKDLAAHCEKQHQAMSAAVLKMFGKPVWMSNDDSSLAAVQANRNGKLSPERIALPWLNDGGAKRHSCRMVTTMRKAETP